MAQPQLATAVDRDADGSPVWAHREGQLLVPGAYAWQRLGVGHRCETWLAWSVTGWHPVVVKLPRPHQVDAPRAWAALTREVYVLTRARHPAIPQLYADRLADACPYVVTEFVDGLALDHELDQNGPLPPDAAAQLTAVLLSALIAVHRTGAAHLDVKPANIVIRDGRPVLLDFGSARPIGTPQPAGRPLGTLGYASPELEACQPISASMDVYGIGVVLAEALAAPTPVVGRLRLLADRRSRSAGDAADLDRGLRRLAGQLTAADPTVRPDAVTALELLSRLSGAGRLWPSWVVPADLRH